ncbi:HU family DNA-binding protein, partial [Acidithiobacillus ferridurans]
MTVTKVELANHLWETMGTTHKEAVQMVEAFFDNMRECIVEHSELMLSNFGRFAVRDKAPRPGRNPITLKKAVKVRQVPEKSPAVTMV